MTDEPRGLDLSKGYTVAVYFPPEASAEVVERFFAQVAKIAGDTGPAGRDPFVVSYAGDVLQVDMGHHECCPPHVYFSTSCFHGDHRYCQSETGLLGNKTPAICKFCAAPCICSCHRDKEITKGREDTLVRSESTQERTTP
jgi:hypothetical protein